MPLVVRTTLAPASSTFWMRSLVMSISRWRIRSTSFTSFNTTYSDTGLFGIYLISQNRTGLRELGEVAMQHCRQLATSITDADVARAKNQLKTSLLFHLDTSSNVADEIGRQVLTYGRRVTPYELDRQIEQTSAEQVRAVALKYWYDADPAVVALGPIEAWPDYNIVRSKMSGVLY